MARIFHNPVAVHTTDDAVATLHGLLGRQPYVLVTSEGWQRRGAIARVAGACGTPLAIVDDIHENPDIDQLRALEPRLAPARGRRHAVVALGGGSVMDAAKAIAAALAVDADMATVERSVLDETPLPADLVVPPLYCVPTTAGTGSEVTRTATIWRHATGTKHSLADDRVVPTAAILDPALTASAPRELTIASALDALSHAMESIWNVNHNSVADAFATAAIARIVRALPRALASADLASRAELQHAATLAGFAISSTRSALAHSISYPLTSRFGLRHGLACSFTLPDVAAFNAAARPDRIALIAEAFGASSVEELPASLRTWLRTLGVYDLVRGQVDPRAVGALGVSVITPGRADNNIRPATAADAHAILYAALETGTTPSPAAGPAHGHVVWITGLSGAGKTTLARAVVAAARDEGREVVLLDSDDLRAGISGRVGHTTAERRALARRYSDLCRFLASQGLDVICATMSLFREIQEWNRAHVPNYHEVYLRVSPARLGARDPKGLYRRAQDTPVVANVVGVDLPFDEPGTPDLVIDNDADRGDLSPLVAQVMGLFRG